jgi:hypothetical protein
MPRKIAFVEGLFRNLVDNGVDILPYADDNFVHQR